MSTALAYAERPAQETRWRADAETRTLAIRARRDAQRAQVAELPDPAETARYLPLELVEGLMLAEPGPPYGWFVPERHAPALRREGLVGYGRGKDGCGLTAYGWAVRKALQALDG